MPTKSPLTLPTFKLSFTLFPLQPSYLAKILSNLKTYITRPYRISLLVIEVVIDTIRRPKLHKTLSSGTLEGKLAFTSILIYLLLGYLMS